jgi:hypothetical protein
MGRIDHVGLQVPSVAGIAGLLEIMGCSAPRVNEWPESDSRSAFFELSDGSMIECFERMREGERVQSAALTHVAIEVEDIDVVVQRLKSLGVEFASPEPYLTAATGVECRTIQTVAESTLGVRFQLVQPTGG